MGSIRAGRVFNIKLMSRPLLEWEGPIRSAMRTIERAGFCVTWVRPTEPGEVHTFTATAAAGEVFTVRGPEPLAAIAELMAELDFEDLD